MVRMVVSVRRLVVMGVSLFHLECNSVGGLRGTSGRAHAYAEGSFDARDGVL